TLTSCHVHISIDRKRAAYSMDRKKAEPRKKAINDKDNAAEGRATEGLGNDQQKAAKKPAAKRAPGRKAGQQLSLNEEEARQEKSIGKAKRKPRPAGTAPQQQRGSSRKSVPDTIGNERSAAEPLPSGRSPDQRGAEPNEVKRPDKLVAATPADPDHETPVPSPAKRGARKKAGSNSATGEVVVTAVPAPVLPEVAESVHHHHVAGNTKIIHGVSLFTEMDMHLFREGKHFRLYEKLGGHIFDHNGERGTLFAVWAPNAESVSVMGDFNEWDRDSHPLKVRDDGSGVWEGFVPGVQHGMLYKYHIRSRFHMYHVEKSDPFAFAREAPPQTASVVNDLHHEWHDRDWMRHRAELAAPDRPMSVYEMHVGSWRRKPEVQDRPLTYRELAEVLPGYLKEMNFT